MTWDIEMTTDADVMRIINLEDYIGELDYSKIYQITQLTHLTRTQVVTLLKFIKEYPEIVDVIVERNQGMDMPDDEQQRIADRVWAQEAQ